MTSPAPFPPAAPPSRATARRRRYGRDHILGCKASFYASRDQNCGYLSCFYEKYWYWSGLLNATVAAPDFAEPDWRHCDAAGNYSP